MGTSSVIVFGPQGCGKTQHAEQLRQHFGCDHICDDDFHSDIVELYRMLSTGGPERIAKFKSRSTLYLTCLEPPATVDLAQARRVLPFDKAMQMAGLQSTTTTPAAA